MKREIGEIIIWEVNDFDGKAKVRAIVTETYADHIIAKAEGNGNAYDGMTLWLD